MWLHINENDSKPHFFIFVIVAVQNHRSTVFDQVPSLDRYGITVQALY